MRGTREWFGPELVAKKREEAVVMLNETAEEGAQLAIQGKWWTPRRGAEGLVGEVVVEPAELRMRILQSKFGSTMRRGFFGLFLEKQQPWIRPAGDKAAAHLLARLRGRL